MKEEIETNFTVQLKPDNIPTQNQSDSDLRVCRQQLDELKGKVEEMKIEGMEESRNEDCACVYTVVLPNSTGLPRTCYKNYCSNGSCLEHLHYDK